MVHFTLRNGKHATAFQYLWTGVYCTRHVSTMLAGMEYVLHQNCQDRPKDMIAAVKKLPTKGFFTTKNFLSMGEIDHYRKLAKKV